ncbi:hypothetical protein ACOME3_007074 [Neoechinorhynchus agilis]
MEKDQVIEMDAFVDAPKQHETGAGAHVVEPMDDNDDSGAFTKAARVIIIVRVVRQYERAVLFRLGKLSGDTAKGPGLFFTIPFLDTIVTVDLRTINLNIPAQEVLTKDSVTIGVDAVLYSRVFNPILSVVRVENARASTIVLAATTLRNMVANLTLSEFLTSRERIASEMQHGLDVVTDQWGLKIERVEITDVKLPPQMQRAMAAEAEADRDAKAKIIAAEGERQASSALKEAADIIGASPAAIQLRYLQTLNAISVDNNSTIVFPIPLDMLKVFSGRGQTFDA